MNDKIVKFQDLFTEYPDGSLEPKTVLNIGGVTLGPGIRFSKGTSFSGIDFTLFKDKDFQVVKKSDGYEILGVYR